MNYINLYYERLAPGLTGEPLNALSNIAFFIAALAILNLARYQQQIVIEIWPLIGLMVAIETGGTLLNAFATQWSNRLDVIPILLFQLYFL